MKHFACLALMVIITFLTLNVVIDICEARGGRGRGGGSFGGIFGGWRKYKKPTSNSNSRRTVNGSPMHTTATKSITSGSAQPSSNSMKATNQQAGYPKQQMPLGSGYNSYGGYYGNGAAGGPPLPPGSTYYPNMGAMPQGAIYYGQPMRSSSGTGDFLVGMLAGHMASNMLFGQRHHVVYHQNIDQTASQTGPKVIVINNGEATVLNATEQTTSSTAAYWPTDADTPLAPFNDTVSPADIQQTGKNPLFQRIKPNNFQNAQMTRTAQQPTKPTTSVQSTPSSSSTSSSSTLSPDPPVNGIICMPILVNETNPNDPSKTQQVERIICFPAPPPPTSSPIADTNCVMRTLIETDPNNPSQTIEIQREICTTPTTTSEPRQVAGEIGESIAGETAETFSLENEKNGQDIAITEIDTNEKSSEIATPIVVEND